MVATDKIRVDKNRIDKIRADKFKRREDKKKNNYQYHLFIYKPFGQKQQGCYFSISVRDVEGAVPYRIFVILHSAFKKAHLATRL